MIAESFGKTGTYLLPERFDAVFPPELKIHFDALGLSADQVWLTVLTAEE